MPRKPAPAARATIRDVAREAGVAVGTASRALNRSGKVSEDAIAAVTQAARRLGYAPDTVARSLRTRSSGAIGLLVSDFSNPLYARIINAVEAELQAAGCALLLSSTRNDARREAALLDHLLGRRVDGVILGPCEFESPRQLAQLSEKTPVVALDRDIEPGGWAVHVDHYHGALQATRYLLNLGHVRIALLTPGSTLRPGRDRIAGFHDAHAERGLAPSPRLVRAERTSMDFAFSEALSLLSAPEAPTAFLCLGTRILAGVLQALRHAGRSIPDDVSVVSIGDSDLSQLFSPAITSLAWDLDAVGKALGQLVLKRAHAKEALEPERILITTQLLLRESCGPAPREAASRAVRAGRAS